MAISLLTTKDGSHTLYIEELNETYHSKHGAIQESEHVFIQHGLLPALSKKNKITILEIGFGTGLNALLTYRAIKKNPSYSIEYNSIEPYPISSSTIFSLNYTDLLHDPELTFFFNQLHQSSWNTTIALNNQLKIHKTTIPWPTYISDVLIDIIYYDAFAPNKQPELWELKNFEKAYQLLAPDGYLVTYCAQGVFKRTLREAGFTIETLPGPPGKREMTRAWK